MTVSCCTLDEPWLILSDREVPTAFVNAVAAWMQEMALAEREQKVNLNTHPLSFLSREKIVRSLYFRTNWSSRSLGHRHRIHRWIAYQGFNPDYRIDLRVSIAHCPDLGGVAVSDHDPIGLDIEVAERIKPSVIERINNPQDEVLGLPIALIWTAKEALFKFRRGDQKPLPSLWVTKPLRLRPNVWQMQGENAVIYSCLWRGFAISVALPQRQKI